MISSPYQIMDNWNGFNSSQKEEIAQKLFFYNVVNNEIPKEVSHTWCDTEKEHIKRAKRALDNDRFTDFWLFLDHTGKNSIELEVRTYADYISATHNDVLITNRLIYTAHIAIHQKEAHIESSIKISALV